MDGRHKRREAMAQRRERMLAALLVLPAYRELAAGAWRITAPHFCAGLVIDTNSICVEAAPILHWAVGRELRQLLPYFQRKGWTWEPPR